MRGESLKGHLDLLLLAVLDRGAAHGYAVVERLREESRGAFDLPEGTIYPALHRLHEEGLLASRWSEHDGRRRRTYHLTARGRAAFARRREEWRLFSRSMTLVVEPA